MRGYFGHLKMGSHPYKKRILVPRKKAVFASTQNPLRSESLGWRQINSTYSDKTVKKTLCMKFVCKHMKWTIESIMMNVSGQDASDEIRDRWSEIEVRHSNQSLLFLIGLLQRRYPVHASTPTNQPGLISTAHTIYETLF